MSQTKKKGMFASIPPRARVAIALVVIAILAVLSFFGPKEQDASNVTGDTLPVTVTVTNAVSTLSVNHSIKIKTVQITVTQVAEAASFSDDTKHGGVYTVRVGLEEKQMGTQQTPVGIDYSSQARLVLANGQVISPKLINIAPAVLSNTSQDGYIDFPVSSQVNLSSLSFRMGGGETVAFGG